MIKTVTAIAFMLTLGVLPAGATMKAECASKASGGLFKKSNPQSAAAPTVKVVNGTRQGSTK